MLLDVVAAALPVHPAGDLPGGRRPGEDVQDLSAQLLHVHHRHGAEAASVRGLTAALGVEGGPVEQDGGSPVDLAGGGHGRFEVEQAAVREVQAVGHPDESNRR